MHGCRLGPCTCFAASVSEEAPRQAPAPVPPAPAPRRSAWKVALLTVAVLAAGGALAAAATVYGGLYNIAGTAAHLQPVYSLIETTMQRSVRLRARAIEPPPLDDPKQLLRGAVCFRDKCLQCHGAPGIAPRDFSKSMQPVPGSLISAARHWRARELYWITRHGIKMSGMPAWEYHLTEADIWAVVAFLTVLPEMTPAGYEETVAAAADQQCSADGATTPVRAVGGREAAAASLRRADAERGRLALRQYGCTACHTVPGVVGSKVHVGPPLAGIGSRPWIAGRLPNTLDNMVDWIRQPQRIDPASAMPDMGVTEQHARDMAAYLNELR